jgi:hypothetical protein
MERPILLEHIAAWFNARSRERERERERAAVRKGSYLICRVFPQVFLK